MERLIRIKSPQLYRLSYRPKFPRILQKLLSDRRGPDLIVSPVYTDVFSGPYHGQDPGFHGSRIAPDFGDAWRGVVGQ